jgi:hypothetical protein
LAEIPSVTFDDVKQYALRWRQKLYSEVLISGNMDEIMAIGITKNIESTMKRHSQILRK